MEENKIEKKEKNSQQQIAGAIIMAGIIIAGAILLKGSMSTDAPTTVNNTQNTAFQGKAVSTNDHIIGSASAKIVIVEYSDLECPFCKVFHNTMHQVVNASNGKVAWVYRHYPIPQLHPKAFHEAEATECAWEQGGNDAFWKYTDEIFSRTESNNKLDVAELPKIAKDIGLSVAAFNTCLDSSKFTVKVQADIDDGLKAGVNGTPSSFILVKGKVVSFTAQDGSIHNEVPGAQPYDIMMQNLSKIK